ncbi:MAG: papain fold toxin domain-containing protein [Rhizonema sp. PD37]|nr:papain fold toxin domain-containing protein [Rhizonema sp. PD37]
MAKFDLYQCDKCATAVMQWLKENRIKGRIIKIQTAFGENYIMDFAREFQPWVQRKYHVSTSNSWANIIMLHCANEQEGFSSFYRLLDEFQNQSKSLDGDSLDEIAPKANKQSIEEVIGR